MFQHILQLWQVNLNSHMILIPSHILLSTNCCRLARDAHLAVCLAPPSLPLAARDQWLLAISKLPFHPNLQSRDDEEALNLNFNPGAIPKLKFKFGAALSSPDCQFGWNSICLEILSSSIIRKGRRSKRCNQVHLEAAASPQQYQGCCRQVIWINLTVCSRI